MKYDLAVAEDEIEDHLKKRGSIACCMMKGAVELIFMQDNNEQEFE